VSSGVLAADGIGVIAARGEPEQAAVTAAGGHDATESVIWLVSGRSTDRGTSRNTAMA